MARYLATHGPFKSPAVYTAVYRTVDCIVVTQSSSDSAQHRVHSSAQSSHSEKHARRTTVDQLAGSSYYRLTANQRQERTEPSNLTSTTVWEFKSTTHAPRDRTRYEFCQYYARKFVISGFTGHSRMELTVTFCASASLSGGHRLLRQCHRLLFASACPSRPSLCPHCHCQSAA